MIIITFSRRQLRLILKFLLVAIRFRDALFTRSLNQQLLREKTVESEMRNLQEMREVFDLLQKQLNQYESLLKTKDN